MLPAFRPSPPDRRDRRVATGPLVLPLLLLACTAKEDTASRPTIDRLVETLGNGDDLPAELFTEQAQVDLKTRFGSLDSAAVRLGLLGPGTLEFKVVEVKSREVTQEAGVILRHVKLSVSRTVAEIESKGLYVLRLKLVEQSAAWKISDVELASADLTLANTGLIFKIYYFWVIFAFYGLLINSKKLLTQRTDPEQAYRYGRDMPGAHVWIIVTFIFGVSWFFIFFPRVFMSHFGLYWGIATGVFVMRAALFGYNCRHFYGRMPGAPLLAWVLALIPLAVFAFYQSKFKPEQTSAMRLVFNGPPEVELLQRVELLAEPSDRGATVGSVEPGTKLAFLGSHPGAEGGFHRVVFQDSTIAFLPARAAKVVPNQRTFSTESELTTELVSALRPVSRHKDADNASIASIGLVYLEDGRRLARRSSVRDHLEALSRYNEALKYADGDDIHLAKAASLLAVVRLMRHDNLLNAFGMFQPAAVSYNKMQALAAYTIDYLRAHVSRESAAANRDALIALALQFGHDDKEGAAKHFDAARKQEGSYVRLAAGFLEREPGAALLAWEEMARHDPESSGNFAQMGTALLRNSLHERARLAFLRAMVLGPDNTEARTGMAAALALQNKMAESVKMIEEARDLSGYNSEAKVLGFIVTFGPSLIGLTVVCLLFLLAAPRIEAVKYSVLGTMGRLVANFVVFSAILVASWYALAQAEPGDGAALKAIVAALVPG